MSLDGLEMYRPKPPGYVAVIPPNGSVLSAAAAHDIRLDLDREYKRIARWRMTMSRNEFERRARPWWRRLLDNRTDSTGAR